MIGLVGALATEIVFESVKFVLTIGLLILAVFIGKNLRKHSDAKKAAAQASEQASDQGNITE